MLTQTPLFRKGMRSPPVLEAETILFLYRRHAQSCPLHVERIGRLQNRMRSGRPSFSPQMEDSKPFRPSPYVRVVDLSYCFSPRELWRDELSFPEQVEETSLFPQHRRIKETPPPFFSLSFLYSYTKKDVSLRRIPADDSSLPLSRRGLSHRVRPSSDGPLVSGIVSSRCFFLPFLENAPLAFSGQ